MFKFKKRNLIALAVCSLLIILLLSSGFLRPAFLNTFNFPLGIFSFLRREAGALIFYHRNFTQKELLSKQVDFLRNKLNTYNELAQENSRLKQILAFKQKSPLRFIAARVTGESPDSWSANIIIDKGRHHGIRKDMAVITYLGLVGRVSDAQEFSSKVMLISDPNMAVAALNQRSRQDGLVTGTLGVNLVMKYLPLEPDIQINDAVITSGLTSVYPKGLLLGSVIALGREFSGLSSYAIIRPAVNLADLEEVLVIVK